MIQFKSVSVRAGKFELRNFSCSVPKGCYAVLMGRTGCGKTTTLEALCGLRPVESGTVLIDGADVTQYSPGERNIGYVPQDLALFPSMTVREHLEFAMRLRKWSKPLMAERIAELAEALSIRPLLDRKPRGLSGGEAQRVALGRALSFKPSVLLLDEPLSALDEATRGEMQRLLLEVKRSTTATILHVTHSQSEADALADVVLSLPVEVA